MRHHYRGNHRSHGGGTMLITYKVSARTGRYYESFFFGTREAALAAMGELHRLSAIRYSGTGIRRLCDRVGCRCRSVWRDTRDVSVRSAFAVLRND